MNLTLVSIIFCILFSFSRTETNSEPVTDESCNKCVTQKMTSFSSEYCRQCFPLPIRFGRSDGIRKKKSTFSTKFMESLFGSYKFHKFARDLLSSNELRRVEKNKSNSKQENKSFGDLTRDKYRIL
jgi:hypothetical protein